MSKPGYFIKGSLKQLLHTPMKTALFFLLIMAVSLLLVFSGALLNETAQRIDAAESEFVTLGTVEQVRDSNETRPLWNSCLEENEGAIEMLDISTHQELLWPEVLDFDGANYVQEPETRPYYIAYMPD